jgi:hypothetical protein
VISRRHAGNGENKSERQLRDIIPATVASENAANRAAASSRDVRVSVSRASFPESHDCQTLEHSNRARRARLLRDDEP